ncbi:hypothetical protein RHSIM_Rhsim09G0063900 [Rhododendron simsii]|uniref:HAT C-terminal dimerisation domain-containing protein n=1 Tax=Rhododendron simsii TaxID=118357 RepID=A0A834GDH2_RHOSS|nr:hypothetical protein RHSIM_Rhsim09G0063900 [Rhododendron simsii]
MATGNTLRAEDDAMKSTDAMFEPRINLSNEEEENERVTGKGQVKPDRAKCKYCKHAYKWLSGNGTSNLKKHTLRWNSTYLMLSTTLNHQKAFERLEEEDPLFLLELHTGPPTSNDWDDARYFADFFKFYDATLHLYGSSYDTSNMYFNEVMAVDGFLSSFLNDVQVMYDCDERIEPFDFDLEKELTQMIRDVLDRAFVEEKEDDVGKMKSEIDSHLAECCEKKTPNFDILAWWKVSSCKYLVLSEITRDALAKPISTIASEAAFSTGGRVVDQFRSSLSPRLVECLICMQDWRRAIPLPFEVEENMEEMQQLELDKISVYCAFCISVYNLVNLYAEFYCTKI